MYDITEFLPVERRWQILKHELLIEITTSLFGGETLFSWLGRFPKNQRKSHEQEHASKLSATKLLFLVMYMCYLLIFTLGLAWPRVEWQNLGWDRYLPRPWWVGPCESGRQAWSPHQSGVRMRSRKTRHQAAKSAHFLYSCNTTSAVLITILFS